MPIDPQLFRAPAYARIDLHEKNTRCESYYSKAADYEQRLMRNKARLFELQEKLAATETWALLMVFQSMDAGGKDEAIKYVMDCFDPQSCLATQFKQMRQDEQRYSYLRRAWQALPGSGQIGIFNRSYYEQVVAERLHPDSVSRHLPEPLRERSTFWEERFDDINASERHWARNGIKILKFFLHISPEVQKKRLLERIENPDRSWEFSFNDVRERRHFGQYLRYYEDVIQRTHSEHAPWYVIPADDDKNARLIIAEIVAHSLEALGLDWPQPDEKKRKELARAKQMLEEEGE